MASFSSFPFSVPSTSGTPAVLEVSFTFNDALEFDFFSNEPDSLLFLVLIWDFLSFGGFSSLSRVVLAEEDPKSLMEARHESSKATNDF